jgi:hypothetical protein
MKTIDVGKFVGNVYEYLRDSLPEAIVVTRDGRPTPLCTAWTTTRNKCSSLTPGILVHD